jgi:hypothetical protein
MNCSIVGITLHVLVEVPAAGLTGSRRALLSKNRYGGPGLRIRACHYIGINLPFAPRYALV